MREIWNHGEYQYGLGPGYAPTGDGRSAWRSGEGWGYGYGARDGNGEGDGDLGYRRGDGCSHDWMPLNE